MVLGRQQTCKAEVQMLSNGDKHKDLQKVPGLFAQEAAPGRLIEINS
jgi:hypothetical protein